jgi:hypothetical protein
MHPIFHTTITQHSTTVNDNALKRTRDHNQHDSNSKKVKLSNSTNEQPIFTREDFILLNRLKQEKLRKKQMEDYRKHQIQLVQENMRKELFHLGVNELRQLASDHGLLRTNKMLKSNLVDSIVRVRMEQHPPQINPEFYIPPLIPMDYMSCGMLLDPIRERQINQFITMFDTLKESIVIPKRCLSTITIHVPSHLSDGNTIIAACSSTMSLFNPAFNRFIKFYNQLRDIVSSTNLKNINNGDIILIPPGTHVIESYGIESKSIEMIGLNSNAIIQCEQCSYDEDEYPTLLQVSNTQSRFHCLLFAVGSFTDRIEHSFIRVRSSFVEISNCRFERMINAINAYDSEILVTNCVFTSLAASALELYRPQTTILDGNEMTKCCLGVEGLFNGTVKENIEGDELSSGFCSKHSMGVIQVFGNDNINLVLVLRGNNIHDNEGCEVTFTTELVPPLWHENTIIISNESNELRLEYYTDIRRVYIMKDPEQMWERNKVCCNVVYKDDVESRSGASNYSQIMEMLKKPTESSQDQNPKSYPIYLLRAADEQCSGIEIFIPEDVSMLNHVPDPSRFTFVVEDDDFKVYYYHSIDVMSIAQFYFLLDRRILLTMSQNPFENAIDTCVLCGEKSRDLKFNKELLEYCETIIALSSSIMINYLDMKLKRNYNWRDTERYSICRNGHIRVMLINDGSESDSDSDYY